VQGRSEQKKMSSEGGEEAVSVKMTMTGDVEFSGSLEAVASQSVLIDSQT
jgi:hypothetical protein